MKHHYHLILQSSEVKLEVLLRNQVKDLQSVDYGSIRSVQSDMSDPTYTIFCLKDPVCLYYNEDSRYFGNEKIRECIFLILDYLDRIQRADGTFDGISTNFYSAPETGFGMHILVWCYRIVEMYGRDEGKTQLVERLYKLIQRSGEGIAQGGFHTPNHRWVEASALLQAYNITGIEGFKTAADSYLAEGIDCSPYGEYAEKSAGIYNATNNNSFIVMAEETGESCYHEYVRRNLDMMFLYNEPDGSIFTMNSRRQDGGVIQKYYPTAYYPSYLYMSYIYGDGRYAVMTNKIMAAAEEGKASMPDCLQLYMLKPGLKNFTLEEIQPPSRFEQLFEQSGIVRVGRDSYTFTLMKNNSSFLVFQTEKIRCRLKMCASFFAVAQFKVQDIIFEDGSYFMKFKTFGYYRLPFENQILNDNYWETDYNCALWQKQLNCPCV